MKEENPFTNILLTGAPGVGKTTLIIKLSERLADLNPGGFYTAEIREGRTRTGFELTGLDGRRQTLSHVKFAGRYRVGRYGVDVAGFERFLAGSRLPESRAGVILLDEIGKMECYSSMFTDLASRILDSTSAVAAVVAQKGGGFIAEVKGRPDSRLVEITKRNRNALADDLERDLRRMTVHRH